MIALAAGAFYFILPQLAQVGDSFKAFQSAHWGWVPVIVVMSFLTYLSSAVRDDRHRAGAHPVRADPCRCSSPRRSSTGCRPPTSAAWRPTFASCRRTASSRPRRSPLSRSNSIVGGVVHIVLIIVFFVWSGSDLANAFSLPSGQQDPADPRRDRRGDRHPDHHSLGPQDRVAPIGERTSLGGHQPGRRWRGARASWPCCSADRPA